MRPYDNRIKYFELLMKYDDISNYKKYELPKGFHYIESGEFTSFEKRFRMFS